MAAASSVMLPAAILFIFAFAAIGAAETTALDQVCHLLGGYYVSKDLCLSVLCADRSLPCRATRDVPAVAALAARLAAKNATATMASIETALSSSRAAGNSTATKGLQACLQLYAGVVPTLQSTARSVAAGHYRGAPEVMQAAESANLGCERVAGDALPRETNSFMYNIYVREAVMEFVISIRYRY